MSDTLAVACPKQAAVEHLRRIVAGAIHDQRIVDAGLEAKRLLGRHPDCGMDHAEAAQLLAEMAAAAGVPVRLSPVK